MFGDVVYGKVEEFPRFVVGGGRLVLHEPSDIAWEGRGGWSHDRWRGSGRALRFFRLASILWRGFSGGVVPHCDWREDGIPGWRVYCVSCVVRALREV